MNAAFGNRHFQARFVGMAGHLEVPAIMQKKVPHQETFPVQDLDVF
jgi:hypothetical protein